MSESWESNNRGRESGECRDIAYIDMVWVISGRWGGGKGGGRTRGRTEF